MVRNPALSELESFIGEWRMELHHAAFLPEPESRVSGACRFEWIEDGAAVVMRQGDAGSPTAKWIFGRDDGEDQFRVLYADDRGVSRVYFMTLADGQWRMWRDHSGFSQRFRADVAEGGGNMSGIWEKSLDGGSTWEHDFNVDYSRVDS